MYMISWYTITKGSELQCGSDCLCAGRWRCGDHPGVFLMHWIMSKVMFILCIVREARTNVILYHGYT